MDVLSPTGDEAPSAVYVRSADKAEISTIIQGYLSEAKQARSSGMNPRDEKWREILDLYWSRYDHGHKADWQARETTPEVPGFIDRFAASLKEAMGVAAEGMFTVDHPSDRFKDLEPVVKRMTDTWLSTSGLNASGQPLGFEAVFEEQMKLGALMSTSAVVLWKNDIGKGRVAVETVDPRDVWLDHTSRGLYRFRRVPMDKHKVLGLMKDKHPDGTSVFDQNELLGQAHDFERDAKEEKELLVGHGHELLSSRKEIDLYEFYGDIVRPDGSVIGENVMATMTGGGWIIRGPEVNPFWHGRDWVTYAPLVTVPLSPYGRAYVEDFGSMARMFNKVTNMILDAIAFSSIKAFATIPEMLVDPGQLDTGIGPAKNFRLQFGMGTPEQFMTAIDLGTLSADTVRVWEMIKSELTEAARLNEVGLGQFAPNSRTSATEVSETQQSTSALVRAVAQTIETRWYEPTVNLVWKTGLQHVRKDDAALREVAGEEMFNALLMHRRQLIREPITFQARGISTLIMKGQKLRSLIQVLQLIASNPVLLQQFMQTVDLRKLVDMLFDLAGLDITRLSLDARELMIRQFAGAMGPEQAGSPPAPVGEAANMMGVAR